MRSAGSKLAVVTAMPFAAKLSGQRVEYVVVKLTAARAASGKRRSSSMWDKGRKIWVIGPKCRFSSRFGNDKTPVQTGVLREARNRTRRYLLNTSSDSPTFSFMLT